MGAQHLQDLYAAEVQEHLGLLQRSLVDLERDPAGRSLQEAFRAAHTIKGLAAAMDYLQVADRAHSLEDALEELRRGRKACTPEVLDTLLAESDELQRSVESSLAGRPAPAPGPADSPTEPLPAGTSRVLDVTVRPDAPFKAARALVILRAVRSEPGVLGWAPRPLPADFDGRLRLFLDDRVSLAAVEARVRGAGDVGAISLADGVGGASAVADEHPRLASARHERQVRVAESSVDRLADGMAELSVLRHRLAEAGGADGEPGTVDRMGQLLAELQREVLGMRMVPVREVFERLPRVVRDACRQAGREADLVLEGEDVELDRAILGELAEPLVHLLRNAVAHGIEPASARLARGKPRRGRITVRAEREHNGVRITVEDDGNGVDRDAVRAHAESAGIRGQSDEPLTNDDLLRLLSRPGFSLATEVTGVSGRGVGLDAVLARVRSLGGAVELRTAAERGTSFHIKLPVTLALAQALWVRVGGEDYAIPLTHLRETLHLAGTVRLKGGRELVRVRDRFVPLVRLRGLLRVPVPGQERSAVVAEVGERRVALAVDELIGHERILVKGFDPAPGTLPVFTGATLRGDGRPALVLDPLAVVSQ